MTSNINKLRRELSFDLFGRYSAIRDIIRHNNPDNKEQKILDVGGRGNLLKQFFEDDKNYNCYYLDPNIETSDKNYIDGDGCNMPIDDNSFDWVVSCDVLEHIPAEKREQFINETIRTATNGTIIACPVYSKETDLAEKNANNLYKKIFQNDHPWLIEHINNGLPREEDITRFLDEKNSSYFMLHNNNLKIWNFLLGFSFITNQVSLEKEHLIEKIKDLNEFYNTFVTPNDFHENSYRKFFVISKETQIQKPEINDSDLSTLLLGQINNKYYDALTSILDDKHIEIDKLVQTVVLKDGQLNELNQTVALKNISIEELKTVIELKDQNLNRLEGEKNKEKIITQQFKVANHKQSELVNQWANKYKQLSCIKDEIKSDFLYLKEKTTQLNKELNLTRTSNENRKQIIESKNQQVNLLKTKMFSINSITQKLNQQVKNKNQLINSKNQIIANKNQVITDKDQIIVSKDQSITVYENSKFWRLRAYYLKFKFIFLTPRKCITKYKYKLRHRINEFRLNLNNDGLGKTLIRTRNFITSGKGTLPSKQSKKKSFF